MEALQIYLRAQGKAFTLWANPQITASNYSSRSSANYPLIELDGMLVFTGFYFLIALWGYIKYYSSQSTTSSNQKSVSSTKSVTTKDNEKKSSDSWSLAKAQAKLNAEPILWFVSFIT
jgi:hypothetical protein